jgi:hypothetical protein
MVLAISVAIRSSKELSGVLSKERDQGRRTQALGAVSTEQFPPSGCLHEVASTERFP